MDPAAELEQLRERAAVEGAEWLRSKVQGMQRDELQSLAAAAGQRADRTWTIATRFKIALLFIQDRLSTF